MRQQEPAWKQYIQNPDYLIAILPGLEVARNAVIKTLDEEIATIRAAINGGGLIDGKAAINGGSSGRSSAREPEAVDPAVAARRARHRRYYAKKKKEQLLLAAPTEPKRPGKDAIQATTSTEFLLAVCQKYGGTASNEQFRAEAARTKVFRKYADPKSGTLSVALAHAIHKKKTLERISEGVVRIVNE